MKVQHALILTAGLLMSNVALAEDGAALMKKSGCTACHQVAAKTVGPALKAVAAKYAGDAGAQAMLEKKVRAGGKGTWGTMAMMPAPASVSDADISTMVAYVLSLK